MTYNAVIEKIMPEVEIGSKEPIMIYRDNKGCWHGDHTYNQYGEKFEWVDDIQDPFAVTIKGYDMSNGSFPYVYDRILNERFRAEYEASNFVGEDKKEFNALINLFEENICEFSAEVMDYMTTLEKPLTDVFEMTSISLKSEDANLDYNSYKIGEFVEAVEQEVERRLGNHKKEDRSESRQNDVVLNNNGNDITVNPDDYTVMHEQQINGRQITISENSQAEHRYMVCRYRWDNILGMKENEETAITNDYLEALDKYLKDVHYYVRCAISSRENEKAMHGVEHVKLTEKDCIPNSLDEELEGRVVIIKPEVLSPEFRVGNHQLKIVEGGFGASPNSRGRAVFCTDLYSGKKTRFERYDIAGIADPEKLPEWAKIKLARLESLKEPGVFEFGGYHFKPIRRFRKGETDKRLAGDSRQWKTNGFTAILTI